jgi:hypothetical protein
VQSELAPEFQAPDSENVYPIEKYDLSPCSCNPNNDVKIGAQMSGAKGAVNVWQGMSHGSFRTLG